MQISWKDILQKSGILLLLVCLPLVFSHVLSLLWVIIPNVPFGYERYKGAVLILWALFSAILFFASLRTRYQYRLLGIFVFVFIASYFVWNYFGWMQLEAFLFGVWEKHHGMLFFGSLAIFYAMCRQFIDANWQKKIEKWLLISATIVCMYAIFQFIWLDFVPVKYAQMPWGIGRVFSTLGNPNYLAGYLLMLLPILAERKFSQVWGYWMLFLGVMILTGSVAGVLLAGMYVAIMILKNVKFPKIAKIALVVFFVWGGVFGYYSAGKKLLSLESRFSLWNSFIQTEKAQPLALVVWHGPDAIYSAAEKNEITLDLQYFPAWSKLDSFHNVFLDIIFFFGVPALVLFVLIVLSLWRFLPRVSRHSLWLFSVFFFINIPISVHFVLVAYFLSLARTPEA